MKCLVEKIIYNKNVDGTTMNFYIKFNKKFSISSWHRPIKSIFFLFLMIYVLNFFVLLCPHLILLISNSSFLICSFFCFFFLFFFFFYFFLFSSKLIYKCYYILSVLLLFANLLICVFWLALNLYDLALSSSLFFILRMNRIKQTSISSLTR